MELGWIDFSKSDRDKVLTVLNELTEEGVLDHLGISRIRDKYSNEFFPGITTIETRAKYFLIVPYILKDLELERRTDFFKIKDELFDRERNCAEEFINLGINEGVIGRRNLDSPNWLQTPPSRIYWAGLRTYQIFRGNMTINQYLKIIASRNVTKNDIKKLGNRNEDPDEASDDLDVANSNDSHYLYIPVYNKSWFKDLDMKLNYEEADFLREQIINSCPKSMIAFILKHNLKDVLEYSSFYELNEIIHKFPKHIQTYYYDARTFSDFVYYLMSIYNRIASNGKNEEANKVFYEFESNLEDIKNLNLKNIFETLDITHLPLQTFLFNAQKFIKESNYDDLENLIKKRERDLKGQNRAETNNPKDTNTDWIGIHRLEYRFGNAKTIMKDIFDGLEVE